MEEKFSATSVKLDNTLHETLIDKTKIFEEMKALRQ
jgi:hypothetical protein